MDKVRWWAFRGRVHAEDPVKSARVGKPTSICGLAPVADLEGEQILNVADVPVGEPCRTCLVSVAIDSTSDEPLDFARGRGYLPSGDIDTLDAV